MLVRVPNELHNLIHTAIDKALDGRPCTDTDRKTLYDQLLSYFNEHGVVPGFSLEKSA